MVVEPGEEVLITVDIENQSNVTWRAYEASGIALGNRWLNKERHRRRWWSRLSALPRVRGKVAWEDRGVGSVDGRAPLPKDLEPGSSIRLELAVRAPADLEVATHELELDLVEEGVTWFRQMGSKPVRLKLRARGTPRVRDRLRAQD